MFMEAQVSQFNSNAIFITKISKFITQSQESQNSTQS